MNDEKTMDDGIQPEENPADEFVDELADKSLTARTRAGTALVAPIIVSSLCLLSGEKR